MKSIFIKKTLCKVCTLWMAILTLWTAWNTQGKTTSIDQNKVTHTKSEGNTLNLVEKQNIIDRMHVDEQENQNIYINAENISYEVFELEKTMYTVGFDQLNSCDKTKPETFLNCKPDPPLFKQTGKCLVAKDCVTVVCKTRFRLDMVQGMIESLWKCYPGVQVIITDDNNDNIPKTWQDFLENHTELVAYFQLGDQAGISWGRKFAANLVSTKYFFQIDDDLVFEKSSNLMKLVNILENSDVDIVAGQYGNSNMIGCMTVAWETNNSKSLLHYYKAVYGILVNYPHCYMLDIVQNVYLARTAELMKADPWDSKFKMYEHTDFFLAVKQNRLKTAICLDVELTEISASINSLRTSRTSQKALYMPLTLRKWGLEAWYRHCNPLQYPIENTTNIKYQSKVMVNGTRDFKGHTQRFY
ncbi:unnamed protein product [Owenia fusiformis]|uniref:Glycosyltransferase 2-like domain-containing protein n=1 Tax=Owenia fusiformis TaxID=6347 RepID=A0A8J1XI48_OWEFU|nr:unnamed protein product [Owenia fusiformis]